MRSSKEKKTKSKSKKHFKKDIKKPIQKEDKVEFDKDDNLLIRGYDMILENINITISNETLIENSDIRIVYGRKYSVLGRNGTGKSTMLRFIYDIKNRFPDISVTLIEQEAIIEGDKTVFDEVIESNIERTRLMNIYNTTTDSNIMDTICEKLEEIGAFSDESLVRKILYGLGFTNEMQNKKVSEFSGGFRMRISLAKALYLKPKLLLLDEPNNHLDINSIIWLTDYLKNSWKNSLVVVSHDKNFINEISTDIIHLENKKLSYYQGSYHSFQNSLNIANNIKDKKWNKVMKKVKVMRQSNITKDVINKYLDENKEFKPEKPYKVDLNFNIPFELESDEYLKIENGNIGYGEKIVVKDINLILEKNSKYLLVGKNGAGKTTLFKTIMNRIPILSGNIIMDSRLRIGYYNQHATDILPLDKTPCEYISSLDPSLSNQNIRKYLGIIGLKSTHHNTLISLLSGGQKSRVLFTSVFVMKPHVLLLDEPTNHLDMETIDELINSIKNYQGSIIVSTHNIHLISETEFKILEIDEENIKFTDFNTYYDKVLETIENYEII